MKGLTVAQTTTADRHQGSFAATCRIEGLSNRKRRILKLSGVDNIRDVAADTAFSFLLRHFVFREDVVAVCREPRDLKCHGHLGFTRNERARAGKWRSLAIGALPDANSHSRDAVVLQHDMNDVRVLCPARRKAILDIE